MNKLIFFVLLTASAIFGQKGAVEVTIRGEKIVDGQKISVNDPKLGGLVHNEIQWKLIPSHAGLFHILWTVDGEKVGDRQFVGKETQLFLSRPKPGVHHILVTNGDGKEVATFTFTISTQ